MYLVYYPYILFIFLVRLLFNFQRVQQEGSSFLRSLEHAFDGRFSVKMSKGAIKRQGIQQLYINDSFAQLYGRVTHREEQRRNKLYFVLSGLYDDMLDQKEASIADVDQMFQDPASFKARNFNEQVLIHVHLTLLDAMRDKEDYQALLNKMHAVQLESMQQFNPQLDNGDLISIACRKGGFSLLMCRHYLDLPVTTHTDAVWYHLGAVIQLSNDVFDLYKDLQEGIYTYANRATSYQAIKEVYDQEVTALRRSIVEIPVPHFKKLRFSILLSLIPALGYVALDNLQRLQGGAPQLPEMRNVPRKALIVDMEKPKNLLRLMIHGYKLGQLIS